MKRHPGSDRRALSRVLAGGELGHRGGYTESGNG